LNKKEILQKVIENNSDAAKAGRYDLSMQKANAKSISAFYTGLCCCQL